MTVVLGIEGTAWCASAALFDAETDSIEIRSNAYQPASGGIHPREAAEHMRTAIPEVIQDILTIVRDKFGSPAETIDAVAFSQGPGLGPCLRITATGARALAGALDVSLVGVNHMVAHLEIGRHQSGLQNPICLNASGANAHVLGYRDGQYRILGETMDTGVGNAIDKFTRHVGWSHPGGPKVEAHAKQGEYVELPYVVKGMDFSFSGIMSAAKQRYDDGTPIEDVCRGLEETIFAMLTEVSERALSLTGTQELVLGGGVGQNERLQHMLEDMCSNRGAQFSVPADRFLRDNAGMIAVLGAKMYDAGDRIGINESSVKPGFRPDEVPVTWRAVEPLEAIRPEEEHIRGAEAIVELNQEAGEVIKRRRTKSYRHPELDSLLRRRRTRSEARLLSESRQLGVSTPVIRDVDPEIGELTVEYVGKSDLKDSFSVSRSKTVGEYLATLHNAGFVHGDPTPRNVRVDSDRVYLIDFGLGFYSDDIEDFAMDLHVYEGSVRGTANDPDELIQAFESAYQTTGNKDVLNQLRTIEERGRYQ